MNKGRQFVKPFGCVKSLLDYIQSKNPGTSVPDIRTRPEALKAAMAEADKIWDIDWSKVHMCGTDSTGTGVTIELRPRYRGAVRTFSDGSATENCCLSIRPRPGFKIDDVVGKTTGKTAEQLWYETNDRLSQETQPGTPSAVNLMTETRQRGRPTISGDQYKRVALLLSEGISVARIMKESGLKRDVIYAIRRSEIYRSASEQ